MRRRRECTSCDFRFTTFERGTSRLQVVKRSGRRQPFDGDKLKEALTRAAHKREVTDSQISGIVARVEEEAADRGGVIPAERIGELCLERLGGIDRGAYFQFAGTLPEITPEIGLFPATDSVRREEDSP